MKPRSAQLAIASLVVACGLHAVDAKALNPNTKDANAIAKAVDAQDGGDKTTSLMTMTLKDASGRKRVRKLQQRSLKFHGGTKTIIFFESPADVRNTALLSVDYDDGNKTDDQWLYLPSLHKSTRISSSEKSGSFLGTDLTYADMTKPDISDYNYKIVKQSAKVGGEDCWVLESRAKTKKLAEETGYLKSHQWISKSKLIPLQVKSWITEGKKLKYMKFGDVKKVDGVWTHFKLSVRTMRAGKVESMTTLVFNRIRHNQDSVTDSDFTERRLEKGL